MYPSDQEAKELICSIGKRMYDKQFVTANDGNMTIRVGENQVIATPTGISKGSLTPEMLLKVDFDGKILEGSYKPTSEMSMHLNVYKHNSEIQSTCHAHPLHLSALACAGIELDMPSTPAAVCIAGRIPVVPYYCSGSEQLADSVIPYVNLYHVINLANHGPLSWGKSPIEAWYRLESAEAACQLMLMLKFTIGKLRPMSKAQVEEVLRFHHIEMTPECQVTAPDMTDNQMPCGFSSSIV
jgi:L-fuculose-phosphate aldolase